MSQRKSNEIKWEPFGFHKALFKPNSKARAIIGFWATVIISVLIAFGLILFSVPCSPAEAKDGCTSFHGWQFLWIPIYILVVLPVSLQTIGYMFKKGEDKNYW